MKPLDDELPPAPAEEIAPTSRGARRAEAGEPAG